MDKFFISTDSTCDLYAQEVAQMKLGYLPLTLAVEEENGVREIPDKFTCYQDYVDFFNLLRTTVPVKTAMNNSEIHKEYFRHLAEQGHRKILHFTISYGLARTIEEAYKAAGALQEVYPDLEIKVVESHTTTVGQGVLVKMAYALQQNGATLEEAYDYVEEKKYHIQHFIMVDDLNHLKRGGRVSSAVAAIGTTLQIKIILSFDKDGKLAVINKIIGGKNRAYKQISDEVKKFTLEDPSYLTVVHTDNEEGAHALAQMLEEKCGHKPEIRIMGPTIGCHVGPNAVAYIFVSKEDRPQ